jgi:hypothetical protein
MGITITQRGEKWRMRIQDEVWEFENKETFEKHLKEVLDLKEKHGRIEIQ